MKINDFQGEQTDISAKTEALMLVLRFISWLDVTKDIYLARCP